MTQFTKLELCFISLCLTFGGAPNPNYWSEVSEFTTNLANAILQCSDWDPQELHSPIQDEIDQSEHQDDYVVENLAKALPLAVQVPVSNLGQVDCYINDL